MLVPGLIVRPCGQLNTSTMMGRAFILTDDPFLLAVAAAQAANEALSALITDLKGPGRESDPALPAVNF